MNDKKDEFKECIAREFGEIAREEEEFLENDTSLVVPEGTKEAVLARVREQIRAYEMEQTRKETEEAINHLSEEDREALELGRKMLKAGIGQNDPEEPSGKKVRRKKKPLKMYLALAAVIVCVLAMGITSMGGPERIVRMMTQDVGDREVEYTVKGEKVKTIENEDEEKAYQEIRNNFLLFPHSQTKVEFPKFLQFHVVFLDEPLMNQRVLSVRLIFSIMLIMLDFPRLVQFARSYFY